jgi:TrmH family RNA methyltransferase
MISKALIKSIKALKLKKYRSKEGKFLVEGIKSVNELILENWEVEVVLATEQCVPKIEQHPNLEVVDEKTLQSLSHLSTNEDCLAVASMPQLSDQSTLTFDRPVVVLDGLQDPGNLGTIIRTLDWFGFDQVICSKDTVDFFNAKTIVASMGSFTRVRPLYIDLVELFKSTAIPIYGMDMSGTDLTISELVSPAFYVLGNESGGLRPETITHLTDKLRISGRGKAESLNVSVAAGILISELSKLGNQDIC